MTRPALLKFVNCFILRDHRIIQEDFWVCNGIIVDPEQVFFLEKVSADRVYNCKGAIIAPGFIDLQINGGFGVDFSYDKSSVESGVNSVAKGLLAHGVTSFYPTLVTSPPSSYHEVLPKIKIRQGGKHGANILGVHVEGPFINKEKKGAHPIQCIIELKKGLQTIEEVYGSLENVGIITLAPELSNAEEVIKQLTDRGITVSLGHSMSNLVQGEKAVCAGASFITHLFNAMLPFHHRDPGLVGLLASSALPPGKKIYFGIIADGAHTHPAALRIAHRTHPEGLVLVSDAISALGLPEGLHHIGQMEVEVRSGRAYVAGTNTLCGSISALDYCVRVFQESTECSKEYALESASLHAAQAVGIEKQKGTLSFGADADFVLLSNDLHVWSTWIAGECVYHIDDMDKTACEIKT